MTRFGTGRASEWPRLPTLERVELVRVLVADSQPLTFNASDSPSSSTWIATMLSPEYVALSLHRTLDFN